VQIVKAKQSAYEFDLAIYDLRFTALTIHGTIQKGRRRMPPALGYRIDGFSVPYVPSPVSK